MPPDVPCSGSPEDWLRHAQSDLSLTQKLQPSEEILTETLCFHAQQAAEKAFKAVLVFCGIEPPKTHSIGLLVDLLPDAVEKPPLLREAAALTDYAVSVRYPGESEPVTGEELAEAMRLADSILSWARRIVSSG